MKRLLPFAFLLAACGDDFFEVRTTGVEPAPQVNAFHQSLADEVLNVSYLDDVPVGPDGSFSVSFGDGSEWSGRINKTRGTFEAILDLPPGYFLITVRDAGEIVFNENDRVVAAEWRQTRSYRDGSELEYAMAFTIEDSRMEFRARDLGDGTRIDGTITETASSLVVDETWYLAHEYRDVVSTTYFKFGGTIVEQTWERDTLGTDPSPDRRGEFELLADYSGSGTLLWFYDHGITAEYDVTQESNGAVTYVLRYEDPSTAFLDGEGLFQFDASYNGNGYYVESYTDGSQVRNDYVFYVDGSSDALFRFENPATPASPDVDGEAHYEPDGSGEGSYNRYDASGAVVESCEYRFDSAGTITSLSCT